jgi:MOB kinase activator 1
MSFLFNSKSEKSKSSSQIDEKKIYLAPENLCILPMVVGRLHDISRLPPKSDKNEWLATNCIQFFNQINVQYGAVSEMCTKDSCPVMCAGPNVYEWQDGKTGRKQKLSARQYVDTAMSFVQKNMQDDSTFPTKFG